MTTLDRSRSTHEVLNQVPPLVGHNLYAGDPALVEAIAREGGEWGTDRLLSAGAAAGSAEAQAHAERAERHEPVLHTHDRYGNRVDAVELDPSWHWLLGQAVEREITSLPWRSPGPGAHVVRAALLRMWIELDMGVLCPVSMTYAGVPALRRQPEIAAEWEPRLTSTSYADGALLGMAMTEKQGGSDLRASTTRADPIGDGWWEITGHKWFCSYPSCDAFLTLAQTEAGVSCFFLERTAPGFRVQRLKDKLGTRSLPSSEVEFDRVPARMVGVEGRGIPTIIEMVNHTRLDCLISSSATMRAGLTQAVHHARHRSAFGRALVEQSAMRNVLADLAVESEAATVLAMRVARSYDEGAAGVEGANAFRRLATAVAKYWVCKRAPGHAAEALECLGGNGYIEESGLPRIYRDAPLNSIWEGSGNVAALDVLRALTREPECLPAFLAECDLAAGADRRLDAHLSETRSRLAGLGEGDAEFAARRVVADLCLALQGSLLVRHAPSAVADAFCASRLGGGGHTYGMLPGSVDVGPILDRALAG